LTTRWSSSELMGRWVFTAIGSEDVSRHLSSMGGAPLTVNVGLTSM
jgi:hypothetical protein